MAPEMLNGQQYGMKTDWWAMGVLFYQLLAGQVPFQGSEVEVKMAIKSATDQDMSKLIQNRFGSTISDEAKELMTGLLTVEEKTRFSWRQVKNSKFFGDLKWQQVKRKA